MYGASEREDLVLRLRNGFAVLSLSRKYRFRRRGGFFKPGPVRTDLKGCPNIAVPAYLTQDIVDGIVANPIQLVLTAVENL
jgi:hypothetical protein